MRDSEEVKPRKLREIGVHRKENDGTFSEESLLTKQLREAFEWGNQIHKSPPMFHQGYRVVFCRSCGAKNHISNMAYPTWNRYEDDYSGRPPGCAGCERK
jgi:hypothetical protein